METGSSTPRYSGVVELTDEQLDQVAGGGGHPPIWGVSVRNAVIRTPNGGPAPDPDGSKAGVTGNN